MRSLRSRLLLGTTLGAALVLSAAGLALYLAMRALLLGEFDEALAGKARTLAVLVERDDDGVEFEYATGSMPEFDDGAHPEYFQIWLSDGTVLGRSGSLGNNDLDRISGLLGAPTYRRVTLPDGRPGRLAGIAFHPRQEHDDTRQEPGDIGQRETATLVIGRETVALDAQLARIRWLLLGTVLASMIVSAAVLALVVTRGLRPVNRLAGQISAIGEGDLGARVGTEDAPTELEPLIDRLNDLLTRFEVAFAREKGFTADMAHELRTPLAGLLTTVEVALSKQRDAEAYRQALSTSLLIIQRTQAMVDNLLSLARLEAGQVKVSREPVSLDDLLHECWRPFEQRAGQRGLQVDWRIEEMCAVQTDREQLQHILCNLFDNAVAYVDHKGRVLIECSAKDGCIELQVSNTGSALSQDQAQHAFDRMWRGDSARSQTDRHCGLGLALSRKIAAVLGASLAIESTAGGMFRVKLTLTRAS